MGFSSSGGAAERRAQRNQSPSFEPGLGDDDIWGVSSAAPVDSSDPWSASNASSGVSEFSTPASSLTPLPTLNSMGGVSNLGGGSFSSPYGSPMGAQQPMQGTPGDMVKAAASQAAITAGKESWEFTKEMVTATSKTTMKDWNSLSLTGLKASGSLAAVGILMYFLSNFLPFLTVGKFIALSGLLGSSLYILAFGITWYFVDEDAAEYSVPEPSVDTSSEWGSEFSSDDSDFESGWEDSEAFSEGSEDEEEIYDWSSFNSEPAQTEVDFDKLNSDLDNSTLQEGIYSRQFLYEQFSRSMTNITPNFAQMREYDEDSEDFAVVEETIQEAAQVVGTKEENLPSLLRAAENDFIVVLTIERTPRLNVTKIAEEVANIYKRDEYGRVTNDAVYATSSEFGSRAVITVYKGNGNVMISLLDIYKSCQDKILNPSTFMPVVLGSSAEGDAQVIDFVKVPFVILSGPPRVGKSWTTKAIMNQMVAYCSPRDLHFYIGDPKGTNSDFIDYNLPHVQRREFSPKRILDMLRYLVHTEAENRRRVFAQYGYKEIFEFRKDHPEIEMPFLFLVLDEMATLFTSLEGEDLKEAKGLLTQLVSGLPALGIKGIFIPHRVKDSMIPKNVSDLIAFRITVTAVDSEIQDNLALRSASDFPWKLPNKGDLGVSVPDLNNGKPLYCRAPVLATGNKEMARLESFLTHLWSRLEPNYTAAPLPPEVSSFQGTNAPSTSSTPPVPSTPISPQPANSSYPSSPAGWEAPVATPPAPGTHSGQYIDPAVVSNPLDEPDVTDFWGNI